MCVAHVVLMLMLMPILMLMLMLMTMLMTMRLMKTSVSRMWKFRQPLQHLEAVHRELSLCLALREWDPFAVPQQELLDAMAAINDSPADAMTCVVRQKAVEDLLYESANFDAIPERMRYHGASRWRLS